MAFFGKVGNVLKQTASKQINSNISLSNPNVFQVTRCVSSKLFVGGLPYYVDNTILREVFNKFGEVVDARVIIIKEEPIFRTYGYVTYASSKDASTAIQASHELIFDDRRLRVKYAIGSPLQTLDGGGCGSDGESSAGYEGNQGHEGSGGSNYNPASGYGGGDCDYDPAPSYGSGDGNYNDGDPAGYGNYDNVDGFAPKSLKEYLSQGLKTWFNGIQRIIKKIPSRI